mmetsp:Transcript_33988/g.71504  ORF Transcript_33988/g.71504 Transcript_33988/m.71504 type:complete len:223 (-) Transcript_33988:2180-2848(-)
MGRWRIIRSLINFPSNKGGSLAKISHHLPDVSNVNISNLILALSSELGKDAANEFGAKLHNAFRNNPPSLDESGSAVVDARLIITTYRAALLAPTAFHEPKRVYFKLIQDFTIECEESGASVKSWLLDDLVRVASVACDTNEEVESIAGLLQESFQRLTPDKVITENTLTKALESCPEVLFKFRSQMISQLTDDQYLALLAGEEVSLQMKFCKAPLDLRCSS